MSGKTSDTANAEVLAWIKSLREGDETAYSLILERYMPLLRKLSSSYAKDTAPYGIDAEELLQEARLALYKAALNYDSEQQSVTFGLFAKICVNRRLCSVKRRVQRKKEPKIVPPPRKQALFSTDDIPEIDRGEIWEKTEKLLSTFEKTVLRMRLSEMSYAEIAQELGRPVKSVDNALARAMKKIHTYADSLKKTRDSKA